MPYRSADERCQFLYYVALLLLMAGLPAVAGCDRSGVAAPPPGRFRVSPVAVPLEGDTGILAAHMGLRVGGVEVAYQGPKARWRVGHEIWQDGRQMTETSWSKAGELRPPTFRTPTFSIRRTWLAKSPDEGLEGTRMELALVDDNRGSTRTWLVVPPQVSHGLRGVKGLGKPITVSDDQTPAVFAFVWDQGNSPYSSGAESVEDVAMRVAYAVVIRVGFEDDSDPP